SKSRLTETVQVLGFSSASVASGKCAGPLSDAARPPYSTYTPHISLPNLRPISHYPLMDL
ncbi:hypothetical protein ACOE99_004917, partial [Escherichia coli]